MIVKVGLVTLAFGLGLASAAAASEQAKQRAETVTGKVFEVGIVNDGEMNFATYTVTKKGDKPAVVWFKVDSKSEDSFVIPVSQIVELEGFRDLKGRHEALGGLMILSELQKRLEGKRMELSCEKSTKPGGATYLVKSLRPTRE